VFFPPLLGKENNSFNLFIVVFGAVWGVPPKFLRRSNHYFGTSCGEEHNTQLGLGYNGWAIMPKSPLKSLD
jgi:hypothetical protein